MRRHYWSCSKLADVIRGTEKPWSETSKGWNDWEIRAIESRPFRYWLAEELLDKIQNILLWPSDMLKALSAQFNNRFIIKTHALTSNLKRGLWHELDDRILYCLFDELANFVEVELAWTYAISDDKFRKRYLKFYKYLPKFLIYYARIGWRSKEAGLEYLEWASKLTNVEFCEEGSPIYGDLTEQALSAQEVKLLYRWWVVERPSRADPYDESGWSDYCELHDKDPQTDDTMVPSMLNQIKQMETSYFKKDEEMLIRLIKVRRDLWT